MSQNVFLCADAFVLLRKYSLPSCPLVLSNHQSVALHVRWWAPHTASTCYVSRRCRIAPAVQVWCVLYAAVDVWSGTEAARGVPCLTNFILARSQIPLYRLPRDVRDNPVTSPLAQIPLRRLFQSFGEVGVMEFGLHDARPGCCDWLYHVQSRVHASQSNLRLQYHKLWMTTPTFPNTLSVFFTLKLNIMSTPWNHRRLLVFFIQVQTGCYSVQHLSPAPAQPFPVALPIYVYLFSSEILI